MDSSVTHSHRPVFWYGENVEKSFPWGRTQRYDWESYKCQDLERKNLGIHCRTEKLLISLKEFARLTCWLPKLSWNLEQPWDSFISCMIQFIVGIECKWEIRKEVFMQLMKWKHFPFGRMKLHRYVHPLRKARAKWFESYGYGMYRTNFKTEQTSKILLTHLRKRGFRM